MSINEDIGITTRAVTVLHAQIIGNAIIYAFL